MHARRAQSGEGKAGFVLWTFIVIAGLLVGLRFIPAQIARAQFRDYMVEMAQLHPRADGRFYEQELYRKAVELDIPLEKKNLKVVKSPNRVVMEATYTVPMDFFVYTYNWHVHLKVDRDIFRV